MGWEYLHWIDLMLTNVMEVVIFKIDLTKIYFLQKMALLGSTKM